MKDDAELRARLAELEAVTVTHDPGLNRGTFEPTSKDAEIFWLPSIGPTGLFLHRRLHLVREGGYVGFDLLARSLGVRWRKGVRNNALVLSLARLANNRCVAVDEDRPTLLRVATTVPAVTASRLHRLPVPLQEVYRARYGEPVNAPGC